MEGSSKGGQGPEGAAAPWIDGWTDMKVVLFIKNWSF